MHSSIRMGVASCSNPHPASIQDRDGGGPLLRISRRIFPFIQRVFADGGYAGGVRLEGQLTLISCDPVMTQHRHQLVLTNETVLARTLGIMGEETLDHVREVRQLRQAVMDLTKRVAQLESGPG